MAATLILRETTSGLGGAATGTEVSATAMNNIYDNVSFSEAASGLTGEYRAIDVYNTGDALAISVAIYISSPTTSLDTSIQLGIDASSINSVKSVATELVAPTSVSFATHETGTELSLPDIPSSSYCRVWLKRIVLAGAGNIAEDTATISYSYA